jgi:hypothetical protein
MSAESRKEIVKAWVDGAPVEVKWNDAVDWKPFPAWDSKEFMNGSFGMICSPLCLWRIAEKS